MERMFRRIIVGFYFSRIFVTERITLAEFVAGLVESANVVGASAGVDLGAFEELQECDGVADYQGWHSYYHDNFAE